MFRAVRLSTSGIRSLTRTRPCYSAPLASRCYSHAKVETDEEFDARWVTYFSKPDIDAWELKKGMNTLIGYDLVPEPKILDSALRACRRLNDLASAIRILEAVKIGWLVSDNPAGEEAGCGGPGLVRLHVVVRPVGRTAKFSKTMLEAAYGQIWSPQRYLPIPDSRTAAHSD
ncbi:cytochrome c oxidase subunit 5A, mitochondrial isoform X1 [Salvelinus sp. IW2-2015]|uniref:cytochrome c oxidase subunit 5A, mitochondrial isoform X1 n=1 Tax=Salvelinus sp. IW2-2015 TaxID=2691554 RepID=UPI0038D3D2C1